MIVRVPKIDEQGNFVDAGKDAVAKVHLGITVNVCSPEFGADPSGKQDSTEAIQTAVDHVADLGGGTVVVPGGVYRVSPPFIALRGYVTVRGDGIGSTIFVIDSAQVTTATEETGVFHTGTYRKAVTDKTLFRTTLRDFSIYTSYANGNIARSGLGAYQHIALEHMNSRVWGVVYNTYLGEHPAEPDAVHTVENLEIWDTAGGMALLGLDDQGCKVNNLRVRRTLKQGLLVGKPFDHPESASSSTGGRAIGAADNKFLHADISDANLGQVGCAGIEVYTSQTKFVNSTSWYNRRHQQDIYSPVTYAQRAQSSYDRFDRLRDGAGWYIFGTRNIFSGCTAQENGGHGFVVVGSQTQLMGCIGESSSYYDTAGTKDSQNLGIFVNTAANFYITNWAQLTQMWGCRAQNVYELGQGAKYGFYIENYIKKFRLRDGLTFQSKDSSAQTNVVPVGSMLGEGSLIEIDNRVYGADRVAS
ncbi:MAG: glycosyl hydrolase family 28-related protein [Rothia sp. (in: high G+C Gram-positive bacteria)]|nr:glycosyl hydrolase family 28-related protein [Rothia sp. (in: high G+C Gram-positive bacteria)]